MQALKSKPVAQSDGCAAYVPHVLFMLICLLAASCSAPSLQHRKACIPADLEDAHKELMRLLPAKEIEQIKAMADEGGMIEYHMGLGLQLRNQWGLWHDSRLAGYFEKLGVHHADDMSGIILETFWCRLHGQAFRLDERVRACQDYWLSMETPTNGSPKDGARIVWVITKGSGPGTVQLGLSTSDHSYWRYAYGSGCEIEPATSAEQKDLDELKETWKKLGTDSDEMLKNHRSN